MIDQEAIKFHVRGILEALGDNPDREGLKDTPQRVAKMYAEVFEGMNYTNKEIAQMYDKTFAKDLSINPLGGDMVIAKDLEVNSYCEHHMALMYDMKVNIGYIPKEKVIGLSKLARIADMAAKRLQLQERIGSDIAEILGLILGTDDIAIVITASHSCMTARGIKKTQATTTTYTLRGRFLEEPALVQRVYG